MGVQSVRPLQSVFCGVGALLCLNAPLSFAEDAFDEVVRSQFEGFGELKLSDPEGVVVLYRQIKAAAHRVCSERSTRTLLIWSKAEAECKRAAIDRAVVAVNSERLAALHRDGTGPKNGSCCSPVAFEDGAAHIRSGCCAMT
jgi:UrcA family protein